MTLFDAVVAMDGGPDGGAVVYASFEDLRVGGLFRFPGETRCYVKLTLMQATWADVAPNRVAQHTRMVTPDTQVRTWQRELQA